MRVESRRRPRERGRFGVGWLFEEALPGYLKGMIAVILLLDVILDTIS